MYSEKGLDKLFGQILINTVQDFERYQLYKAGKIRCKSVEKPYRDRVKRKINFWGKVATWIINSDKKLSILLEYAMILNKSPEEFRDLLNAKKSKNRKEVVYFK